MKKGKLVFRSSTIDRLIGKWVCVCADWLNRTTAMSGQKTNHFFFASSIWLGKSKSRRKFNKIETHNKKNSVWYKSMCGVVCYVHIDAVAERTPWTGHRRRSIAAISTLCKVREVNKNLFHFWIGAVCLCCGYVIVWFVCNKHERSRPNYTAGRTNERSQRSHISRIASILSNYRIDYHFLRG